MKVWRRWGYLQGLQTSPQILIHYKEEKSNCTAETPGRHHLHKVITISKARNRTSLNHVPVDRTQERNSTATIVPPEMLSLSPVTGKHQTNPGITGLGTSKVPRPWKPRNAWNCSRLNWTLFLHWALRDNCETWMRGLEASLMIPGCYGCAVRYRKTFLPKGNTHESTPWRQGFTWTTYSQMAQDK